jgi:hypothetical protein
MILKCLTRLLLVASMLFASSCEKRAADEIDFGTIDNATYRNAYFGLELVLPSGWSIQDQASRDQLTDRGTDMIAGDNKSLKAAIKASELDSLNLLTAFEHPLGSPVESNPAIICMAERVHQLPGIKSGKDYLFHVRKLLESAQTKVTFPTETSTATIGGQEFWAMRLEMSIPPNSVQQVYYSTIIKGYALSFVTSFTNGEEEAKLQKILNTVSIDPPN